MTFWLTLQPEWSYDYIKSGASHKEKCLVLSRTVKSLPCLQNTNISRMTPAEHEILNISDVFSQFPVVVAGLSFTWGYWCTDTAAIVLGLYKCLPAGKTPNVLLNLGRTKGVRGHRPTEDLSLNLYNRLSLTNMYLVASDCYFFICSYRNSKKKTLSKLCHPSKTGDHSVIATSAKTS